MPFDRLIDRACVHVCARVCGCVECAVSTTCARAHRTAALRVCVRDARRVCRSCWQHYTTTVPGGTKWFFLALGGIFPHSLFVWRAVCTRRRSATLSVFFLVTIISTFPNLLLLSTFLRRPFTRRVRRSPSAHVKSFSIFFFFFF